MLPRHIMSMLGNCLAVLAVLLTGCSGREIEVDLSSNFNRSVTVPRVDSLLITIPNSYGCAENSTSTGTTNMCRHTIPTDEVTYQLSFTHANTPPLVLTVTVDDTRKVACRHYIFNTSSEQQPLNFTCIPVAPSNNAVNVADAVIQWRRFINSDEMDQFISGMDTSGRSILNNTSPGDIEITSTDGVTNSSIVIRSPENQHRVGFYVPTVLLASGDEERTEPFVVYLGPRITSTYEFSFIELVDARNFDRIRCEVETFPEAMVKWTRDGGNLSERVELRSLNNITDQLTLGFAIDGELVFDTVQYPDAGVYNCTATNEYSDAEPSLAVRLRVHSRLRPLWPAIGIVGIIIITPLFIIGGHFIDKLWGKIDSGEKDSLVATGGGKRSYSVSDSDNSNNTAGKHYHKAIRRVSSARQELLTESSSV